MAAPRTSISAPLSDTAGAEQYIPRLATEDVLCELEAALDANVRFVVLSGPPGLGKTLLLHVLEERQHGQRQVIYTPFLHFPPSEAAVWLRGCLNDCGVVIDGDGACADALNVKGADYPVLLIVDEAHSMPPETAACLFRMLRGFARRMSVVLAGIEGPSLDCVIQALGEPVDRILLDSRLEPEEARELVDRAIRLRADDPGVSPPDAWADVPALHAAADGNPRVLKALMFRAELGLPATEVAAELSDVDSRSAGPGELQPDLEDEAGSSASTDSIAAATSAPAQATALVVADVRARLRAARRTLATHLQALRGHAERSFDRVGAWLREARQILATHLRTLGRDTERSFDRVVTWLREARRRSGGAVSLHLERLGARGRASLESLRRAILEARRVTEPVVRDAVDGSRRRLASAGAQIRRYASHGLLHIERGLEAAWDASKRAVERVGSRTIFVGATSVAMGILVGHLALRMDLLPEHSVTPQSQPASPAPVSLPPAESATIPIDERPSTAAPPEAPSLESLGRRPTSAVPPTAPVTSIAPVVTLHINAQPWASIRLDGEAIGVTPLSRPDTRPGRYELEAEFPDGRILTRIVEVGPESRFISLP